MKEYDLGVGADMEVLEVMRNLYSGLASEDFWCRYMYCLCSILKIKKKKRKKNHKMSCEGNLFSGESFLSTQQTMLL
jgi:hypothetical protein